MTRSPETSTPSTFPQPLRRRRSTIALAAALGAVVVVGIGVAGTTIAFADTSTPSPAPTVSTSPHHGLHRGVVGREIATDVRSGTDFAKRAQKLATTIIDKRPAAFAKLPAALQTDLTALKKATAGDIATDATTIKTKALSGGYGDVIQKFAERVQARVKK